MSKSQKTHERVSGELFSSLHNIFRIVGFEKNMNGKAPAITITQMRVLSMFNSQNVLHISEISPILGMSVPSVNNVVSRLEAAGYLKRKKNRENKRFTDVSLTEKGKKSIQSFRTQNIRELAELLKEMPHKELQELNNALKRSAEILDKAR